MIMRVMLMLITLYLFCYDCSIYIKMLSERNFRDTVRLISGMLLHILVLRSVLVADDDVIETSFFW